MTTNTNTTQTRQTSSTDTNSNDESNRSDTDHVEIGLTTDTKIELPSELDRGPNGECRCPVDGCDFSGTALGLPRHYYYIHDTSIPEDCFGKETWLAYLRQEHVEKGRSPLDIATDFDSHIGKDQVRNDLQAAGFYFEMATGNVPDATQILLRQDVSEIEDAQRVAAKRRGEI